MCLEEPQPYNGVSKSLGAWMGELHNSHLLLRAVANQPPPHHQLGDPLVLQLHSDEKDC
jgi:hypothetical protein